MVRKEEITAQEFEAYEEVRVSCVTNMYAVKTVMKLSGLDKDTISKIMEEYKQLAEKYLD